MTSDPTQTPSVTPTFGLIVIGDEIMSGKRVDKHLPKVVELLAERGLQLDYADYVGDSPERITATLKRAFESGDVVFSTGGIGATPDDHTRQCAAKALGVDLALHPEAERLIRERMQDTARDTGTPYEPSHPDNIHRLNMGVFPVGAQIIANPYNKIPGFFCASPEQFSDGPPQGKLAPTGGSEPHQVGERGGIYFVPGFPVMAWPMVASVLDLHYAKYFQKSAYLEKSVIVYGAMEAKLTPLMLELEQKHPGIKVFSLPSVDHPTHGRHIELGVKGTPEAVAQAYPALLAGLKLLDTKLGPELVR
jgi:molybdenum cofactor synthesis domain-containing protein